MLGALLATGVPSFAAEPADGKTTQHRSSADTVFVLTTMARAQLEAYDYLLGVYKADPERGWQMAQELNEARGDIIFAALQAYWLCGPAFMSDDPATLRELLFFDRDKKTWSQYPQSLDELVKLNFLSHLPESPYPGAGITSESAAELPPGTILYRAVPAEAGYNLPDAGGLEFFFFAVIDTEENGTEPEFVDALFHGDIHGVVDVIPRAVIWFQGFYPEPGSKYRKLIGH